MRSGKWTLKGKDGKPKSSTFMKTFDIKLTGDLSIVTVDSASGPIVSCEGWVEYRVQGEKPNLLKRTPAFVLDKMIEFIQKNVEEFTKDGFAKELIKAFQIYSSKNFNYLINTPNTKTQSPKITLVDA